VDICFLFGINNAHNLPLGSRRNGVISCIGYDLESYPGGSDGS
jgi:hypothetical protein